VGGQWKAPEDWSPLPLKVLCRDKRDERVEELAIIFSNGDGRRPQPGIPLATTVAPKLAVSNVGCWRWEGTSSVVTMMMGSTMQASGTAALERQRSALAPGGGTQELFMLASGQISGMSTIDIGGGTGECLVQSSASGPALPSSGSLSIGLDLDFGMIPGNRLVVRGTGASELTTTTMFMCNGISQTSTGPTSWNWMEIPPSAAVSMDGKTLQGSFSDPVAGTNATWNLTAMREP
jgi:hypothetical protein